MNSERPTKYRNNKHKRVGRPYKGTVEDESKEPFVPERRSLLRGFKKYFGKRHFTGKFKNK